MSLRASIMRGALLAPLPALCLAALILPCSPAHADGLEMSDDGSLVLALGETVHTIPGERTNIKITYPEDIAIAEEILSHMK